MSSIGERIIDLLDHSLDLPPEVVVVLVSALPIVELRGAIPLAISVYEMPPTKAFVLGVAGNAIPVAAMLRHQETLVATLHERSERLGRLSDWLFDHARTVGTRYERYGAAILAVLVLLGAWKVCLIAMLLDVRPRLAAAAIAIGLLCSGAVVTLLTVGVRSIPL